MRIEVTYRKEKWVAVFRSVNELQCVGGIEPSVGLLRWPVCVTVPFRRNEFVVFLKRFAVSQLVEIEGFEHLWLEGVILSDVASPVAALLEVVDHRSWE